MDKKLENRLYKKFKFLKRKIIPHLDCENGWYDIIHDMCLQLRDINKSDNFTITKVFDKYGDMSVHSCNGNNSTRMVIEKAHDLSMDICDACGNEKDLEQCDKCIVPVIEYPDPEEEKEEK